MFADAIKRASLALHTKDQLRLVVPRRPSLTGFTAHLLEYRQVHQTVHKPCDFYLDDIERDLCALRDFEMPSFDRPSEYARYLRTLPPHVQGVHWYVVSCAHASGGPAIADALGFSSYFLRPRDIAPIKRAFGQWTSEWTPGQQQECLDEIPEVFERASKVNALVYE